MSAGEVRAPSDLMKLDTERIMALYSVSAWAKTAFCLLSRKCIVTITAFPGIIHPYGYGGETTVRLFCVDMIFVCMKISSFILLYGNLLLNTIVTQSAYFTL